jgi:hypothetical protein
MQLYPSKKEQKKVAEVSEISPQHPYSDTGVSLFRHQVQFFVLVLEIY